MGQTYVIRSYKQDNKMTGTCSLSTGYKTGEQDVDYHLTTDGLLKFRYKIYVLDNSELKKIILQEIHVKLYSGHSRYHKTLTTVKKFYHWMNLKKEVAKYVARCLDC